MNNYQNNNKTINYAQTTYGEPCVIFLSIFKKPKIHFIHIEPNKKIQVAIYNSIKRYN